MTLYLKYRPQKISELDLESVREQVSKIAANLESAPHAFLFSGPRGTGKTSAARILAKIVNCEDLQVTKDGVEPCNKCSQCMAITNGQSMDVVEIDTASNRGIDDIRVLRESISLSPTSAKKKVYIMDEAHMLTLDAANAFLKTLEEPPSHAMFILATTDPLKLPETVRSRLTTVAFKKATPEEIARQLNRVADGEKIKVEDGVLGLIAKKADGSFRDAVKILENLSMDNKKITLAAAEEFLYSMSMVNADELLATIMAKDVDKSLTLINDYSNSGGNTKDLLDQLEEALRLIVLETKSRESVKLAKLLMEARSSLPKTAIAQLPLELVVIEWCEEEGLASAEAPASQDKKKEDLSEPVVPQAAPLNTSDLNSDVWSKIIQVAGSKNISLEALLRSSKPKGIDGSTLNLAVYYSFHKERLEVEQYRSILEKVITEVTGLNNPKIKCFLEEPPAPLTKAAPPDILKAAKEIFGE